MLISKRFLLTYKGDKTMLKIKKFISREALNNMMRLFAFIPDKQYLQIMYRIRMGKKLNLDNLQTFNEKLQWLKLYDRRPEYTIMVDKYEAKKYVADRIGAEYIIPTLGVWDKFDDIDFDKLPNQFVLKCTHDSGGLVICRDKKSLDIQAARKKIEKSLKSNFYWVGREWPYKNVKPRIIAEQYMEDNSSKDLKDYKFFGFGGQVKCFKVDFDRFVEHHANYYDPTGNILHFGEKICPPNFDANIVMPNNLKLMDELAEKLSQNMPFLRADFYDVNGKVYFGELTFYPASGFGKFTDEAWDEQLGKWIKLPGKGYIQITDDWIILLTNRKTEELKDYKFFCFDGKVEVLYVSESSHSDEAKLQFFDKYFNPLDIKRKDYKSFSHTPKKPKRYEEMILIAEKLSTGIPHVRVDLYETNNRVYFGELTFYTGSGFIPFADKKWDKWLGDFIKLDSSNN